MVSFDMVIVRTISRFLIFSSYGYFDMIFFRYHTFRYTSYIAVIYQSSNFAATAGKNVIKFGNTLSKTRESSVSVLTSELKQRLDGESNHGPEINCSRGAFYLFSMNPPSWHQQRTCRYGGCFFTFVKQPT